MAFPPISILREKSVCFFVSVSTSSGHFVPKSGVGRGTGAFIYALSADETSPALGVQPLFVVNSPFLGLPFVSLSIMFPYKSRLADSFSLIGSYP